MLCRGESFAKGVALGRGVLCFAFEEHDEEIGSLAILTEVRHGMPMNRGKETADC